MSSTSLNRLIQSPLLSVSLIAACAVTLFPAVRYYKRTLPADIPGVNVGSMSEAIVICYRPGCGCEAHTVTWSHDALATRKPLLVLSQQPQPEVDYIKRAYGPLGANVLCPLPASVIERYSPSGKTTISFLRNGRIVATAIGDGALKSVLDQTKG